MIGISHSEQDGFPSYDEDSDSQPEDFGQWMAEREVTSQARLNAGVIKGIRAKLKRSVARLEYAQADLADEPLEEFRGSHRNRIADEQRLQERLRADLAHWEAKAT